MQAVLPSLIAAVAVILGAMVTFLLNRRMQIEAAWRSEKLKYYKDLINALAQNVEGMSNPETHREFARASNNLILIASAEVLAAHNAYREHISYSNLSRDRSLDNGLLAALVRAMRQDLNMPDPSKISLDHGRLWTSVKRDAS